MVAITVILAAVIAAFVLDIGDTSANPQAGFQINQVDTGETEVTINNIERLDDIRFECDATIPDGAGGTTTISQGDWYGDQPEVGDTFTLSCDREEVGIVGMYDGSEAVMI